MLDVNALPPLTTAQVARLLQVTAYTVRRWCQTGKLAHSKTPGGDYLIARSVVEQYLPKESPGQLETSTQRTKRGKAAAAECAAL